MTAKKKQVEIRVDGDRMRTSVKVREILAMQAGKMDATVGVLARFVWNGNGYMAEDAARELIEDMTLAQLTDAATALTSGMDEAAVPKDNGDAST